ncbi:hypothetical protein [Tenuibacillus multivorans]|uniref:Molybdopterin oxidoreductase Fe4S4 domain-containing protein n=1 Tax=Tenuibacillus multivorans TaxID=237069 RepID=A0A1G9ZVM1_9BACI|nr:hypothetical protein [Tenuibacillus multivorans]GEL76877.1 hypothetical protein TMU01_11120 [Tenuibacillus multivorans]SDN25499.1 Molybdopterin oxidoreductase Fe4S4 domain-containing protein [Tenuibacillus multivorans]
MAWETLREDINVYSQGEIDRWVYSTCNICSNGCGCFIAVKDNKIVGMKGNKDYPINRGRLGPKGENQWWANNSSDRLSTPLIRNSQGVLVQVQMHLKVLYGDGVMINEMHTMLNQTENKTSLKTEINTIQETLSQLVRHITEIFG